MNRIRLGCVKYLNTLPLIQGLNAWRDAHVVTAVPSHLIGMLLDGAIDMGLVSLIDAARSPEPLVILPAGMIGCDGPTLTVRVFSRIPFSEISVVHADTDSHTSAALARVILWNVHGVRTTVVDFDARERMALPPGQSEEWPDTLLLIGDKVVTDSPPAVRYPFQLDLGAAWKGLTGLPFVYAAWMARRSALEDAASSSAIREAVMVLDRARRQNARRLDWVVAANAAARGWPSDLATRYLGDLLRYDLDDRAKAGAERFIELCAGLDLCPARPLEWRDLLQTAAA